MTVLIGLGNPGEAYRETRHNVGFMVIEEIRQRHGNPLEERRARCAISRIRGSTSQIVVARPLTYVNRSGTAVASLLDLVEGGPQDVLVVCDDLYLDLGVIRLRERGGHGGHNGLRSIIESLGTTEFARLRVGVGPTEPDVEHADFVLAPFLRDASKRLPEILKHAADCAEAVFSLGLVEAMNLYNRRPEPDSGGCN